MHDEKPNNERAKKQDYKVRAIYREDCEEFILRIHYAHRWPSITWAFGLFLCSDDSGDNNEELCGIVSYGTPPSPSVRTSLAGVGYSNKVIELNRHCLKYNRPNEASILISQSIKLLPLNKIIVSFADIGQSHAGCIYQATNFMYTGMSSSALEYKLHSNPKIHDTTIKDNFRSQLNRRKLLEEKFGGDLYRVWNSRKHRYILTRNTKIQAKRDECLSLQVITISKSNSKS